MRSSFPPSRKCSAFTLLEVLVTLGVLLVIFVAVMQFVTSVDRAWKSAAIDPFAEAEDAFATVTKNLASATLEPYPDYADNKGNFRADATFVPDHLTRRSDLDFVCEGSSGSAALQTDTGRITSGSGVFFVAPQGYTQTYAHTGMSHLLNAMGYFVEFGDTDTAPAFILAGHPVLRWRLKQVTQPAESLQIFALSSSSAWIKEILPAGTTTLADNIVALIVLPERAASDSGAELSSDFHYDSRDATSPLTRHQLPPRLHLALIAMDEASAQILAQRYGSSPPPLVPAGLFQKADQLTGDLSSLDAVLTSLKVTHRIYQRDILINSAAWSNSPSQ
jgi:uncharacterized protein (TIGR02599 family)